MPDTEKNVMHIVVFKWREDASIEALRTAKSDLIALKEKIDGILDLTCGDNFSDRSQGFHTALVVRFVNKAALEAYAPHPAHQEVVKNSIVPIMSDILVMDYEID